MLISKGTLTWSQVLSAIAYESFCLERKSPLQVGDRNIGKPAFTAGSQSGRRNLVKLTKNSEGRFTFRLKPGMPGLSACLLKEALKTSIFQDFEVDSSNFLNRKRNFLKLLQCGDVNLISDLYRKISNAALPTSHFSFPTRKMEKEGRERGKKKMTFFQTKEHFKSLKIFEQK